MIAACRGLWDGVMMGSGSRATKELAFLLWTGELAANPGDHTPVARHERLFAQYSVEVELFAGGHRVRVMREHQSIFEAFGVEALNFRGLETCLVCGVTASARTRSAHEGKAVPTTDIGASAEFEYFRRFRHVPVQYTCSVQVERLQAHLYRDVADDLPEIVRGPDAIVHRWEDEHDATSGNWGVRAARSPSLSAVEITQNKSELCLMSFHAQYPSRLIARTQSTFLLV